MPNSSAILYETSEVVSFLHFQRVKLCQVNVPCCALLLQIDFSICSEFRVLSCARWESPNIKTHLRIGLNKVEPNEMFDKAFQYESHQFKV